MKIKHRGVRQFVATGSTVGIPRSLASKLRRILSVLDQATGPNELDNPAWRLHPLRGNLVGYWSIRVTGNMRLVFRFDREEVVDIDLVDYH